MKKYHLIFGILIIVILVLGCVGRSVGRYTAPTAPPTRGAVVPQLTAGEITVNQPADEETAIDQSPEV